MAKVYGFMEESSLPNIAAAIKRKNTEATNLTLETMPAAIDAISTGIDTSDASAVASDMLYNTTAYVNGVKVTGSIPLKTTQTYNPSVDDQTIDAGQYISETQTIKGVNKENLPSDLKTEVSVKSTVYTDITPQSKDGIDTQQDPNKLYDKVTVNGVYLQTKNENMAPSETKTISSDANYDGLGSVNVTVRDAVVDDLNSSLKEDKTVTAPLTGNNIVTPSAGKLLNSVTINAPDMSDADATSDDIKDGKKAYVNGTLVVGTHTEAAAGGADTSDATAKRTDIVAGKTAYIAGGKVTGSLTVCSYYTGSELPSASEGEINDLYIVVS